MSDKEFLAWIAEWARQWGERPTYFLRYQDLEYAVQHDPCTILTGNDDIGREISRLTTLPLAPAEGEIAEEDIQGRRKWLSGNICS